MSDLIKMNAVDNTAVAISDLPEGKEVNVDGVSVRIAEPIGFGHKFCVAEIGEGENVTKYGEVIGLATRQISPGQHVHTHNVESIRARGDK